MKRVTGCSGMGGLHRPAFRERMVVRLFQYQRDFLENKSDSRDRNWHRPGQRVK